MKRSKLLPILVIDADFVGFGPERTVWPAIFKRGASGNAAGTWRTGGPAGTTA